MAQINETEHPVPELAAGHSLEAYRGEELIFASSGNWLYPIFKLTDFLEKEGISGKDIRVIDRIVGRAAALLLARLAVAEVTAHMLSEPGRQVLKQFNMPYRYHILVDRVQCRTEERFLEETDPEKVYAILRLQIDSSKQNGES